MTAIHRLVIEMIKPSVLQMKNCDLISISILDDESTVLVETSGRLHTEDIETKLLNRTIANAAKFVLQISDDRKPIFEWVSSQNSNSSMIQLPIMQASLIRMVFYPKEELISFIDEEGNWCRVEISVGALQEYLRTLAFLNSRLTTQISLPDLSTYSYNFPLGLVDQIQYLTTGQVLVHSPIWFKIEFPQESYFETAFSWSNTKAMSIFPFVNNVNTDFGSVSVQIFQTALANSIRDFAGQDILFQELSSKRILNGLTAVLHTVDASFRAYDGKDTLSIIPELVAAKLQSEFMKWLASNSVAAQSIIDRIKESNEDSIESDDS